MPQHQGSIALSRPTDEVFRQLAQPAQRKRWLLGEPDYIPLSLGEFGEGTRWREQLSLPSGRIEYELVVRTLAAPQRLRFSVYAERFEGEQSFELSETPYPRLDYVIHFVEARFSDRLLRWVKGDSELCQLWIESLARLGEEESSR